MAVTVYCGSSMAAPPGFLDLAERVGTELAARGMGMVYGGASVGMMGRLADAALGAGATVTGVITRQLVEFEVAHAGLSALHVVETMHERKQRMTDLCDAFLILPGGFGTMDETFEAITWRQLGIHSKPIVLLNHDRFFAPLVTFLQNAAEARFIRPQHLSLFSVAESVQEALEMLAESAAAPMTEDKWWRA
jgi:hypothetical protein